MLNCLEIEEPKKKYSATVSIVSLIFRPFFDFIRLFFKCWATVSSDSVIFRPFFDFVSTVMNEFALTYI